MIYILFILSVVLLILNYKISKGEIANPAFIFMLGFTFSSGMACFYSKKWELGLHFNTFFMILMGSIIYSFITLITKKIINKHTSNNKTYQYQPSKIVISNKVKILILVFTLVTTVLFLNSIIKLVDGSFSNIGNALYKFRNLTTFKGETLKIPTYINLSMSIVHCLAYWILYIIINNYFFEKKVDWLLLATLIICFFANLLEGDRGGVFNLLLSLVPMILLIKNNYKKNGISVMPKKMLVLLIIGLVLMFGLKSSAKFIGRNDINDINTVDYIAMYAGAEIKNLDLLLQENYSNMDTPFSHTFGTFSKQLSKIFKYDIYKPVNFEKFRQINGFRLGNVYSIYSSFVLDFGYLGFIPMIILIAVVTSYLYEKAKDNYKYNNVNINILIYSFIFGGITFCFFGNKLINQSVTLSFVAYIITWHLLNFIFIKKKIKPIINNSNKNLENVIIVNDFNYVQGGASGVAINTAKLLKGKEVTVTFFSRSGKKGNIPEVNDICLEKTENLCDKNKLRGIKNYIYNRSVYRKFNALLKNYNCDNTIVHVHGWTKSLSSSIFKACDDNNFKYIITFHDYFTSCPNGGFFNYKSNSKCYLNPLSCKCICTNCDSRSYAHKVLRVIRQMKQNIILKNIKYGIYISDFSINVIKKYLPKNIKLYKLLNPIDINNSQKIKSINDNEYYIYVGRVSKEKGVEDFCKAITQLGEKGIVIGDGDETNSLKEKYNNIEFAGWKNKKEVIDYMLKAKALIFPTLWYEGSPLTTVEAMSIGLPCIISSENAAGEFVNNKNGIIYECGNVEDLKNKIKKYNKIDKTKKSKECIKTYEKIKECNYVEELLKIYNNVLKCD